MVTIAVTAVFCGSTGILGSPGFVFTDAEKPGSSGRVRNSSGLLFESAGGGNSN